MEVRAGALVLRNSIVRKKRGSFYFDCYFDCSGWGWWGRSWRPSLARVKPRRATIMLNFFQSDDLLSTSLMISSPPSTSTRRAYRMKLRQFVPISDRQNTQTSTDASFRGNLAISASTMKGFTLTRSQDLIRCSLNPCPFNSSCRKPSPQPRSTMVFLKQVCLFWRMQWMISSMGRAVHLLAWCRQPSWQSLKSSLLSRKYFTASFEGCVYSISLRRRNLAPCRSRSFWARLCLPSSLRMRLLLNCSFRCRYLGSLRSWVGLGGVGVGREGPKLILPNIGW